MNGVTFYIVDVFAEERYAGNQLAVIRGARSLSEFEMQKIAAEMHFSETSFVLSDEPRNNAWDVRIFTPAREVPFAGHPTLGTAYVIKRHIFETSVDEIVLNLKVGKIPVMFEKDEFDSEILWMKQMHPTFGRIFTAAQVSQVLNLQANDVDQRFPVQEVSTGLPFIIVPLKTLDAVKRANVAATELENISKELQAGILVFCPETYKKENSLNVRVFAHHYGVPEDPATGSANGCLAGYLSRYRYFGEERVEVKVEQGYEIGRPSLLLLRAEKMQGEIDVRVGGKVLLVAKGQLVR